MCFRETDVLADLVLEQEIRETVLFTLSVTARSWEDEGELNVWSRRRAGFLTADVKRKLREPWRTVEVNKNASLMRLWL